MSDPCYDHKHMRVTKKNEKGILHFGVSSDSKFAATRKSFQTTTPSLIQNVQLQQQFETFQAKKREKELKRLKEGKKDYEEEETDSEFEEALKSKTSKIKAEATEKRRKEDNIIFEL